MIPIRNKYYEKGICHVRVINYLEIKELFPAYDSTNDQIASIFDENGASQDTVYHFCSV